MNVFGNSLKFTEVCALSSFQFSLDDLNLIQKGSIHVMLRERPLCEGDPQNKIKIELAVIDTGKVRRRATCLFKDHGNPSIYRV